MSINRYRDFFFKYMSETDRGREGGDVGRGHLLIWQPVNASLLLPNTVCSITNHILQQSTKCDLPQACWSSFNKTPGKRRSNNKERISASSDSYWWANCVSLQMLNETSDVLHNILCTLWPSICNYSVVVSTVLLYNSAALCL